MWGLLAARALRTLELPFRLVKAASIVDTLRTDKPSLCLVPGGTASLKYAALGEAGREALRAWVRAGGHYLGFCGGAGLALSDPGAGLGLCPWQRAGFTDRLQHFVSGHVRLRRDEAGPGDELVVDPGTKSQLAKGGELLAPVWWPGRTGREACAAFENAGATRLPADFLARFRIFCARTRSLLLAQRLAVTLPEAVPREPLAARRAELFGTAMHAGGLYQELIQILDARLFAALQRSCG